MISTTDVTTSVEAALHQADNLPSVEESTEELFECQACGEKFLQLYQFDLCRNCLHKRFGKLIPVINKVRK
jgi:protein-arginine kinase activator protein McsA